MLNGIGPIRLILNDRTKFLARVMAKNTKNHKVTRRKKGRPAVAEKRLRPFAQSKLPFLPTEKGKVFFTKDDEEPRAEDLAKEEPIKPEDVEAATAAIEAEAKRAAANE